MFSYLSRAFVDGRHDYKVSDEIFGIWRGCRGSRIGSCCIVNTFFSGIIIAFISLFVVLEPLPTVCAFNVGFGEAPLTLDRVSTRSGRVRRRRRGGRGRFSGSRGRSRARDAAVLSDYEFHQIFLF